MIKTIKRDEVVDFIRKEAKGGKMFAVRFTKKDGSIREMTCRLGVKKGVTGRGRKGWVKDTVKGYGLLGVYDMNKEGEIAGKKGAFRMINLKTLINIKVSGKEYVVID